MSNTEIKKIEWGDSEDHADSCLSGFCITGNTRIGDYIISGNCDAIPFSFEIEETPFEEIEDLTVDMFETEEAAKRACQDQFDRIIGGCIGE